MNASFDVLNSSRIIYDTAVLVGIGPNDLSAFFDIHLDMAPIISHLGYDILFSGVGFPIGSDCRGARLTFELRVNRTGGRLLSAASAGATTTASPSTGGHACRTAA
jgi:hypothetical protein